MNNLENKKKITITNCIKFIFVVIVLVTLSFSILCIYRKINTPIPTIAKIDLREDTVVPKVVNVNPSTVDVYDHIYKADGHKVAYLTFDDGPSANTTSTILKTLDKYNVKATFFIIGALATKYPNLVKMEFSDGQSIANHTYSHDYKYIYSDTNTFIKDVNKCDAVLKSILGTDFNSKLVRFPGGSFGKSLKPFRESLKSHGYNYIDWNDITGDADAQNVPVYQLLNNLKKYTKGKEHVVILMHDAATKATTVQALPQVIEYLKSQNYSFSTLH